MSDQPLQSKSFQATVAKMSIEELNTVTGGDNPAFTAGVIAKLQPGIANKSNASVGNDHLCIVTIGDGWEF